MEQSPSWEAKMSSATQEIPHFMEPEGSSPYTQEPATCLYPEPDQSSPCPLPNLSKIHFNIILPSKPGSSKSSVCWNSETINQRAVFKTGRKKTAHKMRTTFTETELRILSNCKNHKATGIHNETRNWTSQ
jgi:hypothetical protein